MKKIIIFCVLSSFISINMLGMLAKTAHIRLAAKNFKPKRFCNKKQFDYKDIILQMSIEKTRLSAEKARLERENESLRQDLEACLAAQNIKEHFHAEEIITFRSKDRRSSGEE